MASSEPQYPAHSSVINLTAEKLRIEINTHFQQLIQSLKDREAQLLAQLDEILSSYEASSSKLQFKMEELTQLFKVNKRNFELSELHQLQGNILKEIDKELESTAKQLATLPSPEFIWHHQLHDCILTHGAVELKSKTKLDSIHNVYEEKLSALVSVSKKGSGFGELNDPWGLDIDRDSGDIYIADQLNNRVQVFDSECKFKLTFTSTKLQQPLGIAISNGKVFVCEARLEDILVFDLKGELLNRFGKRTGSTNYGIAVRESTGDIYVCNFKCNQIQIYNENMEAVKSLTGFKSPCYVQLTDTHIIVLDKGSPCLHWYNYDLICVKSFITRGPQLQVENVAAFCLDSDGNILMTDNYSIKVFTQEGELIHQIVNDVIFPNGIKIDSKNRIVVVSYRKENNLQMF